jgi:hypothetical protein
MSQSPLAALNAFGLFASEGALAHIGSGITASVAETAHDASPKTKAPVFLGIWPSAQGLQSKSL